MWINSKQRAEPYLGLTCLDALLETGVSCPSGWNLHRCCMAVVSSCR